jgi:hypothetical protein
MPSASTGAPVFGRRRVKGLTLIGILVALAAGCAGRRPAYGPLPVERCETPEGTFQYFREAVYCGQYSKAWGCLAVQRTPVGEGRKALSQQEFEALFESYGVVRDLITDSRLTAVVVSADGSRAGLLMENARWGVRKRFRMVLETVGRMRLWNVDLTRADVREIIDQAERYRETGRVSTDGTALDAFGLGGFP